MLSKVPEITEIANQQKDSSRVSVFLDGEFWTGMPEEVCLEHNLKVGTDLSADKVATIERQVAEEAGIAAAMSLLSFRDRSESELRDRLIDKGYNLQIVEAVIGRMADYGYIDDSAFAQQVASDNHMKGKGRIAAQQALRRFGVDEELCTLAIEAVYGGDGETEAALSWLARKPVPQNYKDSQKLLKALASRGFSFDTAAEAIEIHRQQNEPSSA